MRLLARLRRPDPSPRARKAERFLAAGIAQSRSFGHAYVGTEHVLLALAEDSSTPVAEVLARLGVRGDVVRHDIERVVGRSADPGPGSIDADALATIGIDLDEVISRMEQNFGPGAFEAARWGALEGAGRGSWCIAPRLKKALELAVREAGDGPVRAEHVLVSLASVEDCIAARILAEHGVTLGAVRDAVA